MADEPRSREEVRHRVQRPEAAHLHHGSHIRQQQQHTRDQELHYDPDPNRHSPRSHGDTHAPHPASPERTHQPGPSAVPKPPRTETRIHRKHVASPQPQPSPVPSHPSAQTNTSRESQKPWYDHPTPRDTLDDLYLLSTKVLPSLILLLFLISGAIVLVFSLSFPRRAIPTHLTVGFAGTIGVVLALWVGLRGWVHCVRRKRWGARYGMEGACMKHSFCGCQRELREEMREERGDCDEGRRGNRVREAWKRMSGHGQHRDPRSEDEEAALPRRNDGRAPFDNGEVNRPTLQRNFVENKGEEEILGHGRPSIPTRHMGNETTNQDHGQSAQERIDGVMMSSEQGPHRRERIAQNINISSTPEVSIPTETVTPKRMSDTMRQRVQQTGSGRFVTHSQRVSLGWSRGDASGKRGSAHSSKAQKDLALYEQVVTGSRTRTLAETEPERNPQRYMPGQQVGKEEPLPKEYPFSQFGDLPTSQHEFSADQSSRSIQNQTADNNSAKEDISWNLNNLNVRPLVVNCVVVNSDVPLLVQSTLMGISEEDSQNDNPASFLDVAPTPQSASGNVGKRPEVPPREASLAKKSQPQIATPQAKQRAGAKTSFIGTKQTTHLTKSKNKATPSTAMTTVANKKLSARRSRSRTKFIQCIPHEESTLPRLSRILSKQEYRNLYADLKKNPRSPCYLEPHDGHVYHPGTRIDTKMWIYEQVFDLVRKRLRSMDSSGWDRMSQIIQNKIPVGEALRRGKKRIDSRALEHVSTENASAGFENDSSASGNSEAHLESNVSTDHLVPAGLVLAKHNDEAIDKSHIPPGSKPRNSKQRCSATNKPRRRRPQQKRKSDDQNTTKAIIGSSTHRSNNENPGIDREKQFSAYSRKLTESEEEAYERLHGGGASKVPDTSNLGHDAATQQEERLVVPKMRNNIQDPSASKPFMTSNTSSSPESIHSTTQTATANTTIFLYNPEKQGFGERRKNKATSSFSHTASFQIPPPNPQVPPQHTSTTSRLSSPPLHDPSTIQAIKPLTICNPELHTQQIRKNTKIPVQEPIEEENFSEWGRQVQHKIDGNKDVDRNEKTKELERKEMEMMIMGRKRKSAYAKEEEEESVGVKRGRFEGGSGGV